MISKKRLEQIRTKLSQALAPTYLNVLDEDEQHLGHTGSMGGGHFHVEIASPLFLGKPLIECHRLIYAALGQTMHTEIHALRITVKPSFELPPTSSER